MRRLPATFVLPTETRRAIFHSTHSVAGVPAEAVLRREIKKWQQGLHLPVRCVPLQPASLGGGTAASVEGAGRKKSCLTACFLASTAYLCSPFQPEAMLFCSRAEALKKSSSRACITKNTSYLCSPLRFAAGLGLLRQRVLKKYFQKHLRNEKKLRTFAARFDRKRRSPATRPATYGLRPGSV